MNFSAPSSWEPRFLEGSFLFDPLRAVGESLASHAWWPMLEELQHMAEAKALAVASGKPIRFVPQGGKPRRFEEEYEPRAYLAGEVQTREENWHDLFNALVWLAFPKAKAAINARHYAELIKEREAAAGRKRGQVRDRLTQFDESGVLILCADPELAEMLRQHQWQRLFWDNRARVRGHLRFLVFGHSLYEKALRPYPGMTGKGLVLSAAVGELEKPMPALVELADAMLAGMLADEARFGAETRFQPLPVLGVPDWTPENGNPEYYVDARYFRPKR